MNICLLSSGVILGGKCKQLKLQNNINIKYFYGNVCTKRGQGILFLSVAWGFNKKDPHFIIITPKKLMNNKISTVQNYYTKEHED